MSGTTYRLIHGDCLDVLRTLPDNSVDSIVTDPPYGLTDRLAVGHENCLGWPLLKVMLPDLDKADSKSFKEFNFSGVSGEAPSLHVIDRSRINPGIAVPISPVDFNGCVAVGQIEINDGGEPSEVVADCKLPDILTLDNIKLSGNFVLKFRHPSRPALCKGACSCYRQLGPGLIGVPIIITFDPCGPGLDGTPGPSGAAFFRDDIRSCDHPAGEAGTSSSVVAFSGAECRAVLALDLSGGSFHVLPAKSTLNDDDFRFVLSPSDITTGSAASGLPAMLEPSDIGTVQDAADGASFLDCVIHVPAPLVRLITRIISQKGFMGKDWDGTGIAFSVDLWREALRVLKPGGHMAAFGGTRTYHRIASAIEDAGFEIRDTLFWIHGQGFPKSLDVGKAIDKAAGVEREEIGRRKLQGKARVLKGGNYGGEYGGGETDEHIITAPATDDAKKHDGKGTALKPAVEPIVLARKPLSSTVAGTVLEWGTGALNIEKCRVGTDEELTGGSHGSDPKKRDEYQKTDSAPGSKMMSRLGKGCCEYVKTAGRWPPHLLLTHSALCTETECAPDCPVLELGRQSGESGACAPASGPTLRDGSDSVARGHFNGLVGAPSFHSDTGTAARFFPTFRYSAKPSRAEKEAGITTRHHSAGEATGRKDGSAGLDNPRAGAGRTSGARNHHPTVKGLDLMRWLIKLITPEAGAVLDPFMGSGSTGCAALMEEFNFIGVEREAEYLELARQRIRYWAPMWSREID